MLNRNNLLADSKAMNYTYQFLYDYCFIAIPSYQNESGEIIQTSVYIGCVEFQSIFIHKGLVSNTINSEYFEYHLDETPWAEANNNPYFIAALLFAPAVYFGTEGMDQNVKYWIKGLAEDYFLTANYLYGSNDVRQAISEEYIQYLNDTFNCGISDSVDFLMEMIDTIRLSTTNWSQAAYNEDLISTAKDLAEMAKQIN